MVKDAFGFCRNVGVEAHESVDEVESEVDSSSVETIFPPIGKPVGSPSYYRLTDMEKHQVHQHILINCTHVDPFVQEFKEKTRRRMRSRTRSAAIIQRIVHREFASWFYNRVNDGDTISFAKEVEEDESPVMDIEASAVNNEDDHMITEENQSQPRCFSTESVLVSIPTPIPTPSLSTHPPPTPTPPFTSNPTPRPPIPTPSLSTDPPPTSTPPFTSNPTPHSPIPTPSLSTHPPPAPTPPFTSNPTPRPSIPTPSLSTDPPSASTPPLTSDPNTRQVPPYVAKSCNRYWIVDIEDSHGVKREGRLKTNGVWTLPAGQRIIVPFNRQGQPIGEAAGLLMPSNYKDTAFSNIKAKFCLDNEIAKCFVLKKLGNNWRNYRGWLFHTFYEVEMCTEHNLDNHPDFIPYDMWAGFVDYRLNPRTQEISKKNCINRRKLKMPHTCGSKSIARKKHEMSEGPVSRGAIFVANHKKRDGSFVNDEAKNVCMVLQGRIEVDAKFIPKCYVEAIQIYVYDSLGMTEWRREDV
ncbi:hypothetical protein G2W53_004207 [Senna tora]|uniref:Uncharacterized protein n=1 Tax=Senna tora TaxID=362788 RepID=A0A834XCR3_9FABA|nr:hypothetical protein G2W53_004207 [Senna tora]